jgi:hypothetical protein
MRLDTSWTLFCPELFRTVDLFIFLYFLQATIEEASSLQFRTKTNFCDTSSTGTENPCVPGSIPGLATISVNMRGVASIPYAEWAK